MRVRESSFFQLIVDIDRRRLTAFVSGVFCLFVCVIADRYRKTPGSPLEILLSGAHRQPTAGRTRVHTAAAAAAAAAAAVVVFFCCCLFFSVVLAVCFDALLVC